GIKIFQHRVTKFAVTSEIAKSISPVPPSPNPISRVRRSGRALPEAEDQQSPSEFQLGQQMTSPPFRCLRRFLESDQRAFSDFDDRFLLPIAFARRLMSLS